MVLKALINLGPFSDLISIKNDFNEDKKPSEIVYALIFESRKSQNLLTFVSACSDDAAR